MGQGILETTREVFCVRFYERVHLPGGSMSSSTRVSKPRDSGFGVFQGHFLESGPVEDGLVKTF